MSSKEFIFISIQDQAQQKRLLLLGMEPEQAISIPITHLPLKNGSNLFGSKFYFQAALPKGRLFSWRMNIVTSDE